jgi:excisionase family DNA binding protein
MTDDDLLRPREVAEMFGVRTTTIARWAREGKLTALHTPGGHRRYRLSELKKILDSAGIDVERTQWEEDAARLYDQGWSIRQVAEKFECGYGRMRRILHGNTTLRSRSGKPRWP